VAIGYRVEPSQQFGEPALASQQSASAVSTVTTAKRRASPGRRRPTAGRSVEMTVAIFG
jgi:hypothetical protein